MADATEDRPDYTVGKLDSFTTFLKFTDTRRTFVQFRQEDVEVKDRSYDLKCGAVMVHSNSHVRQTPEVYESVLYPRVTLSPAIIALLDSAEKEQAKAA